MHTKHPSFVSLLITCLSLARAAASSFSSITKNNVDGHGQHDILDIDQQQSSFSSASSVHRSTKSVEYTWTLRPRRASSKDTTLSVDCNLDRLMMLVNDQYPGPPIIANVGDTVKVTLINESPTDTFALHFHGLDMRGQPYVDGTAMVTQCASGPLQTTTYEFVVNDAGTHYWHGHVSMERADGMQGPIIISDPTNQDEMELDAMYDEEETVFLQDWYHLDGNMRRTGLDTNPFIWIGNAQSFLINGGGIYQPCLDGDDASASSCAEDCSVENYIKSIEFESGKTYRLRIIAGTELIGVNFAIQGHTMTVVEVEGTIVEPYEVENLDLVPGQRYSVLVKADAEPGNYWATTSSRFRDNAPMGYLNIKYKDAPLTMALPTLPDTELFSAHPSWDAVEPTVELENNLFTKDVSRYDDADVLGEDVEVRRIIIVGTQANDDVLGLLRWAANNVTMMMGNVPMITKSYDAVRVRQGVAWPDTTVPDTVIVPDKPPTPWNYTEPVQDSVGTYNGDRGQSYIALTEDDVVEVVLQNARALNGVAEMHSWHLHGHKFYVVGLGFGTFDEETDPESYNLVNPVRRDTVSVLPLGWTAIRFKANNPGAWAFHCTQPAHAMMGMGFNFITSPDKLDPPPSAARSCVENSLVSGSGKDDDNVEVVVALDYENPELDGASSSANGAEDMVRPLFKVSAIVAMVLLGGSML